MQNVDSIRVKTEYKVFIFDFELLKLVFDQPDWGLALIWPGTDNMLIFNFQMYKYSHFPLWADAEEWPLG